MRIAMAGNPNSGKTTMYNALTGRSEKIGNWAGVTVDKKESAIKKKEKALKEIKMILKMKIVMMIMIMKMRI